MDVESEDLEEGLTDHPVVACGVDALAYQPFEIGECALDLPYSPVSGPFHPFVVRQGAPFRGSTASGHAAAGFRDRAGQEPHDEGDIVSDHVLPVLDTVIRSVGVDLRYVMAGAEHQLGQERERSRIPQHLLRQHPCQDLVGIDVDHAVELEPAPVLRAHLPFGHAPQGGLGQVQARGVDRAPPGAVYDISPHESGYDAGVLGRSPEDPRPGELGRAFVERGVVWERIPVARQESGRDTCRLPEIEVEVAHYEGDPEHHRIGVSKGGSDLSPVHFDQLLFESLQA